VRCLTFGKNFVEIGFETWRAPSVLAQVYRASCPFLRLTMEGLMTDARIERIKKALGLTDETRKQDARQNLDRALIEIEHNDGRADTDCLRTISRVVGQLATVEWILGEENE